MLTGIRNYNPELICQSITKLKFVTIIQPNNIVLLEHDANLSTRTKLLTNCQELISNC